VKRDRSRLDGIGRDSLPARLHELAKLDDVAGRRWAPKLLFEFAARDGERILALVIFALGNGPGAIVLPRPERTTRMDQQKTELEPASAKQQDACAALPHVASSPARKINAT